MGITSVIEAVMDQRSTTDGGDDCHRANRYERLLTIMQLRHEWENV